MGGWGMFPINRSGREMSSVFGFTSRSDSEMGLHFSPNKDFLCNTVAVKDKRKEYLFLLKISAHRYIFSSFLFQEQYLYQ